MSNLAKIAAVLRSLADNTVTGLPTFCWACGQQDWVQPCRKCLRIAADALDTRIESPESLVDALVAKHVTDGDAIPAAVVADAIRKRDAQWDIVHRGLREGASDDEIAAMLDTIGPLEPMTEETKQRLLHKIDAALQAADTGKMEVACGCPSSEHCWCGNWPNGPKKPSPPPAAVRADDMKPDYAKIAAKIRAAVESNCVPPLITDDEYLACADACEAAAKLPRTANGVPVIWELQQLFHPSALAIPLHHIEFSQPGRADVYFGDNSDRTVRFDASACYSTLAAARAARQKESHAE